MSPHFLVVLHHVSVLDALLQGVNKSVILSLVDELLSNKAVNIWWLPDNVERIFYYNIISLLLSVLDEILDGMNLSFAGVRWCRAVGSLMAA